MDMIWKMESACMGFLFSMSRQPTASSKATSPWRATNATAPGIIWLSTKAWSRGRMVCKRLVSKRPFVCPGTADGAAENMRRAAIANGSRMMEAVYRASETANVTTQNYRIGIKKAGLSVAKFLANHASGGDTNQLTLSTNQREYGPELWIVAKIQIPNGLVSPSLL